MARTWTTTSRCLIASGAISLLVLAMPAVAEQPWSAWSGDLAEPAVNLGDPDLEPDVFGLEVNMDYISAEEFVCSDPANVCDYAQCDTANYWCSGDNYVDVFAAVEVPTGALITGMRIIYYDNNAAQNFSVRLRSAHTGLGTRGNTELQSWVSNGSPGLDDVYVDVDPDVTVVRRYPILDLTWGYRSYYLWVTLPPSLSVQMRGVCLFWYRQISPAPASATFNDVPVGHNFFRHVEALAASGITAGCGGGNFCPDAPLTRGQMAVFLAKALGLHWNY